MKNPGHRLRLMAARLCSPIAMERLVEPALADMQTEYREAQHRRQPWRRCWILIAGYIACSKVIALGVCDWSIAAPGGGTASERDVLKRTIGLSALAMAVVTILLALPSLLRYGFTTHAWMLPFVLLLPQALGLAVPVGFVLGLTFGLRGRPISRRLGTAVLGIAVACSIASLGNLGWLIPIANQAFRVSIVQARAPEQVVSPPPKGMNELTLRELNQRIGTLEDPDRRAPAFAFHLRWALSCATPVLGIFALILATRGPVRRWKLSVIVAAAFVGYYVLLVSAHSLGLAGSLPPIAAAWVPNVVFALISSAMLKMMPRTHASPCDSKGTAV